MQSVQHTYIQSSLSWQRAWGWYGCKTLVSDTSYKWTYTQASSSLSFPLTWRAIYMPNSPASPMQEYCHSRSYTISVFNGLITTSTAVGLAARVFYELSSLCTSLCWSQSCSSSTAIHFRTLRLPYVYSTWLFTPGLPRFCVAFEYSIFTHMRTQAGEAWNWG